MIEASCHCGAVKLEIATPPKTVTDCNCSICRRYGALWAYYKPEEVKLSGPTDTYIWGEKRLAFHRCEVCGNLAYWQALKGGNKMGVNARLMEPQVLAAARVRKLDGAETWKYLDEG